MSEGGWRLTREEYFFIIFLPFSFSLYLFSLTLLESFSQESLGSFYQRQQPESANKLFISILTDALVKATPTHSNNTGVPLFRFYSQIRTTTNTIPLRVYIRSHIPNHIFKSTLYHICIVIRKSFLILAEWREELLNFLYTAFQPNEKSLSSNAADFFSFSIKFINLFSTYPPYL